MSPQDDIRRLTALINALNPQLGTPVEHTSKDNNIARFYSHLSNILTTGRGSIKALAVTGGLLTSSSYDLTLVGQLSADSIEEPVYGATNTGHDAPEPPVAEDTVEAVKHPGNSPVIAENSNVDKRIDRYLAVRVNDIDLNNEAVIDPREILSGEQVFQNEVVEVFQKLRDPSVDYVDFVRHVLRRCISKIQSRIKASNHFFTESLDDILSNWVPTGPKLQTSIRFKIVPSMRRHLKSGGVDWELVGEEEESEINGENLAVWINMLGKSLRNTLDYAEEVVNAENAKDRPRADDAFDRFTDCLQVIYRMQRVITKHPELVEDTSLKQDLFCRLRGESKAEPHAEKPKSEVNMRGEDPKEKDGAAEDQRTELEVELNDEEAQCLPKPLDPNGKGMADFINRYLRNIVSVQVSAVTVKRSSRKFFNTETKLAVRYVTAQHPDPIPANLVPLLEKAIPTSFTPAQKAEFLQKWTPRLPKVTLRGTVHCEALLMSLATTESPASALGLTDQQLQVYKDSNRRIGVAKKCCWTCHWLVTRLNLLMFGEDDKEFATPGTHGIVFPWTAPPGLSESVCLLLVKDLKRELTNTVVKLIKTNANATPPSAQSSPTSSAGNSPTLHDVFSGMDGGRG